MIFAFILIVVLSSLTAQAGDGPIRFQHINADDGLSNSTVNCILQDKKGFFWFGTFNGLNRYDGYQFTSFVKSKGQQNSICSNRIIALSQDQQGILWIGSNDNGISTYDEINDRFTNYYTQIGDENSLSNNTITSIFCDSKGRVWIGTAGGGLNLYLPEVHGFKHYSMNSTEIALPSNHVTYLAEDHEGNLWFTTDGLKLCCFNFENKTCKTFNIKLHKEASFISYYKKIYIHDDILWIGTEGTGIFAFDLKRNEFINLTIYPPFDKLNDKIIKALQIDKKGRMWIATDGNGLNIISSDYYNYDAYNYDYCSNDALSSDALLSLYIDQQQNVWLGTYQSGINLFRKNTSRFEILKQNNNNGLNNRSVLSIVEDENQDLWIGTDGGGLNHLHQQSGKVDYYFNSPSNPNSISGNIVKTIYADKQKNLWLGTFGRGLNKFDRTTGQFKHYNHNAADPQSLSHENIWALCEDQENNFWIGTLGNGLNLFDMHSGKSIQYVADFNDPKSIIHPLVTVIYQDSKSNLWIGTEGGLDLFNPGEKKFSHFRHNDTIATSLSNNLISCIFEDSHKNLWIGTDGGGLDRLSADLKTFNVITVANGLPNNSIQSIQEDNEQCLWMSTRGGICRYNLKTGHIVNFDRYDGLPSNEFNGNSSLHSKTGKLYFGSTQGLCSFFPSQIEHDTTFPQLVFTALKVYNSNIETGRKYNGKVIINENITYTEKVHLTYKENVFSLEFSAFEYSAPSKINYRYKLEGFNENWTTTDHTRRTATYTNLEGGNYKFILCSTNAEGEWNPNPVILDIQIDPPYWKTVWFKILVLVCLLGILLIIYSYNIERHRQKLREEALTNEKEMARQRNEELRSELASSTMLIAQKNEVLQHVIGKLGDAGQLNNKSEVNESISLLQKEIDRDSYWEQFHYNFDRVYMNLLTRLKEKHPDMTRTNLKLCAYLRLNLSSKEIASLLNITVSGIDKARNRLRKKLNLDPNEDLYEFLLKF